MRQETLSTAHPSAHRVGNTTPLGESWGESFYTLPTLATLSTPLVVVSKEGKAQMVDKMIYISTSTLKAYGVTDLEKNGHIFIYILVGMGCKRWCWYINHRINTTNSWSMITLFKKFYIHKLNVDNLPASAHYLCVATVTTKWKRKS